MLKTRILTALVLVPLTAWALFWWPHAAFAAFLGVFIVVGAWEWTALCGLQNVAARLIYAALIGVSGGFLSGTLSWLFSPASVWPFMAGAVLWWFWAIAELIVYRDVHHGFLASRPGKLVSGFFLLLPAWMVPLALRGMPQGDFPDGRWLALFVMVIVWTADTGAYFAGHRWGRTKLAPHVSPGKTWEGVAGGLVSVGVMALLSGLYGWHFTGTSLVLWTVLAVVTAFVSVFGDLFESRAKRAVGVKDSGVIFPGHGGVLDRIDAYTAAAPFFALMWILWRTYAGGV